MEGGQRTRGICKETFPGKPLVSVITPTLNSAASLERTIQSVLGQTYDNVEYIVIDGLSGDATPDIIARYEDRIAYWISEPDTGIFAAMNKGLSLARGELVGIINSDDWYVPHAVEDVVGAYRDDPRAGVFHGDLFVVDSKGEVIDEAESGEKGIFSRNTFKHPACFLTREAYGRFGLFREDFPTVADYELLLRLYTAGVAFHHIDQPLAYFSLGGVSDTRNFRKYRENYAVRREYGILSDYEYYLLLLFLPLRVAAYRLKQALFHGFFGGEGDHAVVRAYRRLRS